MQQPTYIASHNSSTQKGNGEEIPYDHKLMVQPNNAVQVNEPAPSFTSNPNWLQPWYYQPNLQGVYQPPNNMVPNQYTMPHPTPNLNMQYGPYYNNPHYSQQIPYGSRY